ncbi:MAG TPA: methyltransferase domain-containing protein, partial [Geobacterales bacterium]|nr:methyltransferase domain-containing protein [Geobacterales bacterium]
MQHGRSFEIDQRIWTALENIVNSYDKVTHSITLCLDDILREEAVKDIKKSRVLDVGAGTGALSNKLREKDKSCYIVMLDPIKNFNLYLKKNKENDVVQGVAEYLPFKFKAFDFAISAFMLRDAMDLDKALQNFKRVALKNVILDFWKPDNIIILFFELLYMFSLMPLLAMAR